MILAGLGSLCSFFLHFGSLFGLITLEMEQVSPLFFTVFIIWFPTVFVANSLSKDFKRKNFWKVALRGCPLWMKIIVCSTVGYAFVTFIVQVFVLEVTNDFVLFSGHILPFYVIGFSVLYSFIVIQSHDPIRRCPNGHPVSASAKFCEECGEELYRER